MMSQNEYVKSKFLLTNKLAEVCSDIECMEQEVDRVYKISFYLIHKYKNELLQEFGIEKPESLPEEATCMLKLFGLDDTESERVLELYQITALTNKIQEIMEKEMPEPWYCYSFGAFGGTEQRNATMV